MITSRMTLLEIVERWPETETAIRTYDAVTGVCLLCHRLFDSVEAIAAEFSLDTEDMVRKLNDAAAAQ